MKKIVAILLLIVLLLFGACTKVPEDMTVESFEGKYEKSYSAYSIQVSGKNFLDINGKLLENGKYEDHEYNGEGEHVIVTKYYDPIDEKLYNVLCKLTDALGEKIEIENRKIIGEKGTEFEILGNGEIDHNIIYNVPISTSEYVVEGSVELSRLVFEQYGLGSCAVFRCYTFINFVFNKSVVGDDAVVYDCRIMLSYFADNKIISDK